jgi:group I intron endonuclease
VFPNNKIYIGYTSKTLEDRKRKHYEHSKHEQTNRTPIMNALLKYSGQEEWTIIHQVDSMELAHKLEIEEIAKQNSTDISIGYNISRGGDGIRHTKLTKAKISIASTAVNKARFSDIKNVEKQSRALLTYWSDNSKRLTASIKAGGKPFVVYSIDGEKIGEWQSQRQCARDLNLSPGLVNNCLKKRRTHSQYTFSFLESKDG